MTEDLRHGLHAQVDDLHLPAGTAATVLRQAGRGRRHRRQAMALALLLVAGGTAVTGSLQVERGTQALVPAFRPDISDPLLRDGDRVTGTGRVVAVPGDLVQFCPLTIFVTSAYPDPVLGCSAGLEVVGVDLSALTERRARDGAVEGVATLTGAYRAGVLTVEEQVAPASTTDVVRPAPPCAEPTGGWPRRPGPAGPDSDGLEAEWPTITQVLTQHPGQLVELSLLRPGPQQTVLGLTVTDEAARASSTAGLLPALQDRLCVVASRYTREEVQAARAAVQRYAEGPESRSVTAWSAGQGNDLQVVLEVEVWQLTSELAALVSRHPEGLVVPVPGLVPLR